MAKTQLLQEKPDKTEQIEEEKHKESFLDQPEEDETGPEGADSAEVAPTFGIPLTQRDITNQKAEEVKKSRKLPSVPGMNASLDQLDEWFSLLDENHWSHIAPYIYRVFPAIVRQLSNPDNDKYIDLISKESLEGKILSKYIEDVHGGGTYKIWVVDLDDKSPAGNSKKIIQTTFVLDWGQIPPILNLNEIDVNNKKNLGFISKMVSEGKMDGKGNIMQPTQGTNGGNGNPAELAGAIGGMYEKFMGMFTSMNKDQQATITKLLSDNGNKKTDNGIEALMLEKLKQDDPNKSTSTMIAMLSAMKEMVPKQDDSTFKLIITMMQDNAKNQMEMMKSMMEMNRQPAQAEKSDDFIDKFIKYKTAMPEMFGGNSNPAKKETAEIIMEGVREFALPAIGIVSQIIQMRTGAKPIIPITPEQAHEVVQQQQHQQVQQQNRQIPGQPQQQEQNKVVTMPNPNTEQPNPDTPKLDPNNLTVVQKLLIQYGGMFITAIKSGMTGAELADKLEETKGLFGVDIYQLVASQGKEEILKAMKSIPEFWDQTGKQFGEAYMNTLVDDFLTEPEEEEEDDSEEELNKVKEPVQ